MSDEDMDNFVFAIYPKRTAGKMQKEFQDLVCVIDLIATFITIVPPPFNFLLRLFSIMQSGLFNTEIVPATFIIHNLAV